MKIWNFEELRESCRARGISESVISDWSVYATSLDIRYMRAKFHAENAHNTWKNLLSHSFSFGDDRYINAEFSYEASVEACVQSLHSMADLLSQIINILILEGRRNEKDVSLKKVAEYIRAHDMAHDILLNIDNLIASYEFNYIDAFSNIIKHRHIINTKYKAEYGGNYRNEEGLVFDTIIYKDTTYPETWAIDVIEKYRAKVFELIIDVGLSINNYLR